MYRIGAPSVATAHTQAIKITSNHFLRQSPHSHIEFLRVQRSKTVCTERKIIRPTHPVTTVHIRAEDVQRFWGLRVEQIHMRGHITQDHILSTNATRNGPAATRVLVTARLDERVVLTTLNPQVTKATKNQTVRARGLLMKL